MRKKCLFFLCSAMLCIPLMGCSVQNEEMNDDKENNTENVEENTENTDVNTGNTEDEAEDAEDNTQTQDVISPLPHGIDINHLDDCTLAVSLEQGDAYVDDTGILRMDVTVYTYDLYDMVDIAGLEEGDIIVIRGQEIVVTSFERNERGLIINGGLEQGGYEFGTDDTTVWYESGYSDMKAYYEIGKTTIRVSADMNFYDNSDLEKGEVIYYPGDFLIDTAGIVYHFVPNNTSIVIEDGMIIRMDRRYTP